MVNASIGVRRVQLLNGNYMVNLSAAWARARGLERGSEVELILNSDGDLILRPVRE